MECVERIVSLKKERLLLAQRIRYHEEHPRDEELRNDRDRPELKELAQKLRGVAPRRGFFTHPARPAAARAGHAMSAYCVNKMSASAVNVALYHRRRLARLKLCSQAARRNDAEQVRLNQSFPFSVFRFLMWLDRAAGKMTQIGQKAGSITQSFGAFAIDMLRHAQDQFRPHFANIVIDTPGHEEEQSDTDLRSYFQQEDVNSIMHALVTQPRLKQGQGHHGNQDSMSATMPTGARATCRSGW